ncbi:hypothetical protein CC1G_10614 [Coprinopsis cinerea okayama7|uniref:CFEM domain-containing protein n=1 Tax=Coprinopsis cinerea (strain Okayama-7 / 130 / ATCC MYA-4618 / FGSC 9003) TaxID=240176 RepID=A8P8R8_COPC7|nr:hypothetical protein CC1G_10614 [Coprinopsis cinerea okayama7\|eukprot:XP_001839621.2 hypothetical protein CC1G_10614 [Coprinopsis cinerea okayama7\
MLFKSIVAAFVFSASTLASSTTVPECIYQCFTTASASIGCNGLDSECVKSSSEFNTVAEKCISEKGCTGLPQAEGGENTAEALNSFIASIRPTDEVEGNHPLGAAVKRTPRSSNGSFGSLEKRQCNSGREVTTETVLNVKEGCAQGFWV